MNDMIERVARYVRRAKFKRTRRLGCLDETLELTENELDDAKAAIDAMDDWQPIETAPKDGTRILCFNDGGSLKKPFQCVDRWRKIEEGLGWSGFGKQSKQYYPHTHWKYLPEPPKETP